MHRVIDVNFIPVKAQKPSKVNFTRCRLFFFSLGSPCDLGQCCLSLFTHVQYTKWLCEEKYEKEALKRQKKRLTEERVTEGGKKEDFGRELRAGWKQILMSWHEREWKWDGRRLVHLMLRMLTHSRKQRDNGKFREGCLSLKQEIVCMHTYRHTLSNIQPQLKGSQFSFKYSPCLPFSTQVLIFGSPIKPSSLW